MPTRRPSETPDYLPATFGELATGDFCDALGWHHLGVAWLFRCIGRCASAAIRPLPWPVRLGVLLAVLGAAPVLIYRGGLLWYYNALDLTNEMHDAVTVLAGDLFVAFHWFSLVGACMGLAMLGAILLAFIRMRVVLYLLRALAVVSALFWMGMFAFVWYFPDLVAGNEECAKLLGGVESALFWRNEQWVMWIWACVPPACVNAVLLVCVWRGKVHEYYSHTAVAAPLIGDRVYDNIRTHGKDPQYRTSMYWPVGVGLLVLFGPMILRGCGWEEDYAIPLGSGKPKVTIVQVKRIKREKPEKLVLNMDSTTIWERPKLKDIKIRDEMIEETSETYQANKNIGKLGAGGGDQGGWPHGVANARVRWIRLKYDGGNWDVNMGHGADYNMLLEFNKLTGFKIADNTEYKEISRLARFRKGKAPPFVYMTGRSGIRLSSREAKILRAYCLVEGGMLFADNAGGHFDHAFRGLCRKVFPGKQLVDIPDDDPLYREPFLFPNGAPPLWHHNNQYRPMGIRHEGRWAVFYHSGDMGDAWKTGHSDASKAVSERAYKLGINIMYYTFTRYLNKHHPPK